MVQRDAFKTQPTVACPALSQTVDRELPVLWNVAFEQYAQHGDCVPIADCPERCRGGASLGLFSGIQPVHKPADRTKTRTAKLLSHAAQVSCFVLSICFTKLRPVTGGSR